MNYDDEIEPDEPDDDREPPPILDWAATIARNRREPKPVQQQQEPDVRKE